MGFVKDISSDQRKKRYLFFVVVMSYECILKYVPFYIIYAFKFPFPKPQSVGSDLLLQFSII